MSKIKEQEVARKLYTPSEVMDIFQISRPTFSDWKRRGIFQTIAIPGRRRTYVTARSVDKLLSVPTSER